MDKSFGKSIFISIVIAILFVALHESATLIMLPVIYIGVMPYVLIMVLFKEDF